MNFASRILFCGGMVGLLAASAQAVPAIVEFEVVAINGAPITPSTDVTVNRGDIMKIDYFLEGWTPNLIQTYQVGNLASGMTSGAGGSLELVEQLPCAVNGDCFASDCLGGFCSNCFSSLYVEASRPAYIFVGVNSIPASDCASPDALAGSWRFGATRQLGGTQDEGARRYVGTAHVRVGASACGNFAMGLDPDLTLADNHLSVPIQVNSSATLTVRTPPACPATGACCDRTTFECIDDVAEIDCPDEWTEDVLCADLDPPCAEALPCVFLDVDPPNCAIDARQPHDLNNQAIRFGWDQVLLTFNAECDVNVLTPDDLATRQLPNNVPPVVRVETVTPVGGNQLQVDFNNPINHGRWTCLRLTADASQEFCWGYLPADVNSDLNSTPSDILVVIDCINGVATVPCDVWQVDADRSDQPDEPQPPDILRVIDLLNGAAAFDPWFGAQLDPASCPSE